jgi:transcriptional antiterminator Rof (Rho-off)
MDAEGGYLPIACDFHDDLEAYAVTNRRVRIFHAAPATPALAAPAPAEAPDAPATGATSAPQATAPVAPALLRNEGRIQDIYTTAAKEEFLRLDDGVLVRLDRIRSIEALA